MAQTKTAVVQTRLDAELARRLLTQMALIRRFEEKAAEMYALGKIGGFLHLYIGQEAVAVGATSAVRVDAGCAVRSITGRSLACGGETTCTGRSPRM